jgi:hypothetical protein
MKPLRALAVFLGPPAAALAVAFAHHPEFRDAFGATLFYFAVFYWAFIIPWTVIAARISPPGYLRLRTRLALAIAAPAVMHLFFWWGGLGVGAALLVAATLPADWMARRP